MIRMLIVSETRMMCELLAAVLREEEGIHVAGFAHDSANATSLMEERKCNMALIDANLSDPDALDVARTLREANKELRTVIIGLVDSKTAILRCVEEGINGYVLEDETVARLVRKIYAVHEGQFEVSPRIAATLMERVATLKQMTKELYGLSLSQRVDGIFTELTPREWEVLELIEKGYDNQMIADTLVIEKGTVKNHVHSILSKLDVNRREQAALLVRQLPPDEKRFGENGSAATLAMVGPEAALRGLNGARKREPFAY